MNQCQVYPSCTISRRLEAVGGALPFPSSGQGYTHSRRGPNPRPYRCSRLPLAITSLPNPCPSVSFVIDQVILRRLSQSFFRRLRIKDRALPIATYPIIFQHAVITASSVDEASATSAPNAHTGRRSGHLLLPP